MPSGLREAALLARHALLLCIFAGAVTSLVLDGVEAACALLAGCQPLVRPLLRSQIKACPWILHHV